MPVITGTTGKKAPKHTEHDSASGVRVNAGPFVGIVKNNVDPMRAGRLQVWIPELSANPDDSAAWRIVSYASPFFGSNSFITRSKDQSFEGSPHSYGMWFVPPDVGNKVICTFVNGDPFRGYWFACVPEWPNMHMVPGIANGAWHGAGPEPLVEYNDQDPASAGTDNVFFQRAQTPHAYQTQVWQRQGLLQDRDRGPGTSSAFRETPSRVFGISTPGPEIAVANNVDPNNPEQVDLNTRARQGGHQFIMDDGDIQGNNQLIRLRTTNGNMLLMNDSAGFIYMINSAGSAWFEMDATGNVRIFSQGSFEVKGTNGITLESNGPVKISGSTIDLAAKSSFKASGMTASLSGMMTTTVSGMMGLDLFGGMKVHITGMMCVGIMGMMHVDIKGGCIGLNTKIPGKASPAGPASPGSGPTHEPYGHINSATNSPSTTRDYSSSAGVIGGNSGSYGAAASFGNTASVPQYYGVLTNSNGPIKFTTGLQGSLEGQAANLGDAASYNAYDTTSTYFTNADLKLPVAATGFAIDVSNPSWLSLMSNDRLTPGEVQNNPGNLTGFATDPFAVGQVNGLNVYASPEDGIAALTLMLDLIQQEGSSTVEEVINAYVAKKGLKI